MQKLVLTIGACLVALLVAAGLFAPTFIDEGLTLVEIAGQEANAFPSGVKSVANLKETRLEATAPLQTVLRNLNRVDRHPPLYYILLWIWTHVAGTGLYRARLLSVAIFFASVYVFGQWSRSLFTTMLFAFSPLLILFGTLARDYVLAVFFIVVTVYLLDSAGDKNPWSTTVAASTGAAAVWSHYLAVFPIAVLVLWKLAEQPRSRKLRAAGALFFALITPVLFTASSEAASATPTIYKGATTLYEILRSFLRAPVNAFQLFPGPLDLAVSALFLILFVTVLVRFRNEPPRVLVSIVILTVQLVALMALSAASHQSLSTPRYLGLVAPFYCVLIGEAVTRARKLKRIAAVTAISLIAGSSVLEAAKLVYIRFLQKQAFGGDPAHIFVAAGSGMTKWAMPETLVSDLPEQSKFLLLKSAQDVRTARSLIERQTTFFCPTPEDDHIDGYDRFQRLFPAHRVRLFREFDCSSLTPDKSGEER